jgi:hypothetical protein
VGLEVAGAGTKAPEQKDSCGSWLSAKTYKDLTVIRQRVVPTKKKTKVTKKSAEQRRKSGDALAVAKPVGSRVQAKRSS